MGQRHTVTVAKLLDFGAFVHFSSGYQTLLHISEIAHERVRPLGA